MHLDLNLRSVFDLGVIVKHAKHICQAYMASCVTYCMYNVLFMLIVEKGKETTINNPELQPSPEKETGHLLNHALTTKMQ